MPKGVVGRNKLEPLNRASNILNSSDGPTWIGPPPIYEPIRAEYDAIVDPYCPYTRTKKFKKHLTRLEQIDKNSPNHIQMSKSLPYDLQTGMNTSLSRPAGSMTIEDKSPVVQYGANINGLTFSSEAIGNPEESEAELDVLKAILTREGYLTRLGRIVETLEKKFKPEIADILDLVRISTVNVVESIEKWRVVKVYL